MGCGAAALQRLKGIRRLNSNKGARPLDFPVRPRASSACAWELARADIALQRPVSGQADSALKYLEKEHNAFKFLLATLSWATKEA
jgi:hypothetical protein